MGKDERSCKQQRAVNIGKPDLFILAWPAQLQCIAAHSREIDGRQSAVRAVVSVRQRSQIRKFMRRSALIQGGEHIQCLGISWETANLEPVDRHHQIFRKP